MRDHPDDHLAEKFGSMSDVDKIEWMIETHGWALEPIAADPASDPPTPACAYSIGMRARLGFSVCYFMNPDILLIDEALGVGDLEFRQKSTKVMQEKIKSDQTVVLVSHNAQTIRQLCNRAVWIENGVSRLEGDVDCVVDAYEAFVKSNPRARSQVRQRQASS